MRWSTGDVWGSEPTLSDAVMADTCHCTFAQTHGMHDAENKP